MRIGVLVGKLADGGVEYLGKPGEIGKLDALLREIVDAGGVVQASEKARPRKYVKLWLSDVSANPLKARKCG